VKISVETLASKAYADRPRKLIDSNRAAATVAPGDPRGDTTPLQVVDREGNAVTLLESIYFAWGSGAPGASAMKRLPYRQSSCAAGGDKQNYEWMILWKCEEDGMPGHPSPSWNLCPPNVGAERRATFCASVSGCWRPTSA
jgi:Gamma-glutamyltranspeptidase